MIGPETLEEMGMAMQDLEGFMHGSLTYSVAASRLVCIVSVNYFWELEAASSMLCWETDCLNLVTAHLDKVVRRFDAEVLWADIAIELKFAVCLQHDGRYIKFD